MYLFLVYLGSISLHVIMLRMEGSCKYNAKAVMNCRQGVVLQIRGYAKD